jgi:hypothetical protein
VESAVKENPVMKVAAAGLTPMFPVTAEVGTVEIPLFARITKLPAVPSLKGSPVPPSVDWLPSVDGPPSVDCLPFVELAPPELPHPAADASSSSKAASDVKEYDFEFIMIAATFYDRVAKIPESATRGWQRGPVRASKAAFPPNART